MTEREEATQPPAETTLAKPASPAGYMMHGKEGLSGTKGTGYDYILASDGLWVQAQNDLLTFRIPVANAQVRGLLPAGRKVELKNGPIPASLLNSIIKWMQQDPDHERYAVITWTGDQYQAQAPPQDGRSARVRYQNVRHAALEIHSHGRLPAFFSSTDDADEQGLRLYAVAGRLDQETPTLALRAGVYGHMEQLHPQEVL